MAEVWKDIPGYLGYQVSNYGRVRSPRQVLKPREHTHGYHRVSLSLNGKETDHYVHRLVADAFIPKVKGKTEVNHIDGDKANNCVENLEWADRSVNELHKLYELEHGNARKVKCVETGKVFRSISEAERSCKVFNLSRHIRSGRPRVVKGFHWEYA